jgi:membrane associated rhomboid family serine protease
VASLILVLCFVVGYLAYVWAGGGVNGLASMGALIWYAEPSSGSPAWFRVLTSPWIHGDPIILALNCYAIWSSGRIVEPRLGGSALAVICVVGGLVGTIVALAVVDSFPATLWGGGFMALATVGASLPAGGRLARRAGAKSARRWYVIIGMFASGLSLSVVGLLGWRSGICGSAVAFVVGLLSSVWISRSPARGRSFGKVFLAVSAAATVVAFGGIARGAGASDDSMGAPCIHESVYFSKGLGAFGVKPEASEVFGVPSLKGGLVDELALRTGNYVQLGVLPSTTSPDALLRPKPGTNPAVFESLLPGFNERFSVKRGAQTKDVTRTIEPAVGSGPVALWEIYRGGEVIGEAWFVRRDDHGPVIALFGTPYRALSGVDVQRYVSVVAAGEAPATGATPTCMEAEAMVTAP